MQWRSNREEGEKGQTPSQKDTQGAQITVYPALKQGKRKRESMYVYE